MSGKQVLQHVRYDTCQVPLARVGGGLVDQPLPWLLCLHSPSVSSPSGAHTSTCTLVGGHCPQPSPPSPSSPARSRGDGARHVTPRPRDWAATHSASPLPGTPGEQMTLLTDVAQTQPCLRHIRRCFLVRQPSWGGGVYPDRAGHCTLPASPSSGRPFLRRVQGPRCVTPLG